MTPSNQSGSLSGSLPHWSCLLNPRTFASTKVASVRCLPPAVPPPVFAADPQNGFQQAILRPMLEQALPKVHKNAGVKALIIQRQGQRIFPIQPAPHHLSRLAVGEVFQRLQDGDQRQSPRRFCGSSPPGGKISKIGNP